MQNSVFSTTSLVLGALAVIFISIVLAMSFSNTKRDVSMSTNNLLPVAALAAEAQAGDSEDTDSAETTKTLGEIWDELEAQLAEQEGTTVGAEEPDDTAQPATPEPAITEISGDELAQYLADDTFRRAIEDMASDITAVNSGQEQIVEHSDYGNVYVEPRERDNIPASRDLSELEAVALTIYNGDLALIKETRTIKLEQGTQDIVLENVSGELQPETVHLSIPDVPGISLLEQNYDYDLVSREKLLEKFIGRRITVIDDENEMRYGGQLLSVRDGLVLQSNGEVLLDPPGRIVLPAGAANDLLLRPTLSWQLDSPQAIRTSADITYLSGGLDWQSDYVLLLNADDTAAGMEGWVTISNYSGTTYHDAGLKLIAGEVNRVRNEPPGARYATGAMDMAVEAEPQFAEEEFFEYHLYDLSRPTTVKNNQQKQVGLLNAQSVPLKKLYLFNTNSGGDVQVNVEFRNDEASHLGMPLPKGTVRVFKADSKGDVQFVGEDRIDHTPRNEDVRLGIGNAFDIIAEARKMDHTDLNQGERASYEVVLRNHKEQDDVEVTVEHNIWGDWKVLSSNFDFTREDAGTIQFKVPVPADGEEKLTFEYEIRRK
jgi:hypothetical protein